MAFVDDHLIANEQVLYRTSVHWLTRLRAGMALYYLALAAWPAAYVLRSAGVISAANFAWMPAPSVVAVLVLLALAAVPPVMVWMAVASSEFAVTTHRLIFKTGFVGRQSLELQLSKVESIAVHQGILGRMFGYGTIVVIGTGGTREPFSGVARPMQFRRAVTEATDRAQTRPAAPAPATSTI